MNPLDYWRRAIRNWLRWSEKYTRTDMVYVAKGNFWQVLGQIVTTILSFALLGVFAHYLPKETYGLYRYILSLASVIGTLSLTGMNQAVAQAVARGDEGSLRTSVRYQLKWNVITFLAFCALGGYYFYNNNSTVAIALLIMGICSPLTSSFNTFGAYLDGRREFRLNGIFGIISMVVYAFGMMVVIILSGEIIWLIAAYSLSTLGTTFAFYLITLRRFQPPKTKADDTLKYGRELTFIGFIGPVVAQIDKIILTHFWGATQLAIYSLALAIPDRAAIAIKNLVSVGMPKFAAKRPEELNSVFYLRIYQGLLVGAGCTVVYMALAPYVFTYLLPKYLDALFYSQLLSISFIFGMPNRYISLLMTSQRLSKLIFVNSVIQNSVRALLYLTLGVWGGILGLVLAQVLFNFISMLINIILWRLNKKI